VVSVRAAGVATAPASPAASCAAASEREAAIVGRGSMQRRELGEAAHRLETVFARSSRHPATVSESAASRGASINRSLRQRPFQFATAVGQYAPGSAGPAGVPAALGPAARRVAAARSAMCGRLRVGRSFLHACSSGRSSHVFGLLVRFT
jgi:hypothetical protein